MTGQVWSTDITYLPMATGFMDLAATIGSYNRYVVAWRLSNTLDDEAFLATVGITRRLESPPVADGRPHLARNG